MAAVAGKVWSDATRQRPPCGADAEDSLADHAGPPFTGQRRSLHPQRSSIRFSVPENGQQNDDGDWHAQKEKQK
jgi:hypothetical protein